MQATQASEVEKTGSGKPGVGIAVGTVDGPVVAGGRIYRGVGLHWSGLTWNVTHLRSGHRICGIRLAKFAAQQIATEIAECGDWEWSAWGGWKNSDPGLLQRTSALLSGYGPDVQWSTTAEDPERFFGKEVARQIPETYL